MGSIRATAIWKVPDMYCYCQKERCCMCDMEDGHCRAGHANEALTYYAHGCITRPQSCKDAENLTLRQEEDEKSWKDRYQWLLDCTAATAWDMTKSTPKSKIARHALILSAALDGKMRVWTGKTLEDVEKRAREGIEYIKGVLAQKK